MLEICWSILYGGGSWLGGIMYENMGIRSPFEWSIVLMGIGAVLSVFLLREPEDKEE